MNSCLFSSASVEWATPQALFDELDAEFHFNLDPCCTHENAKCAEHFTKEAIKRGVKQVRAHLLELVDDLDAMEDN